MALSGIDIVRELQSGGLVVTPISKKHMQLAGIQLSLGHNLARMKSVSIIDPRRKVLPEWEQFKMTDDDGYVIRPGEFLLGHTLEKLTIPPHLLGMVDGRSTMGRLGLTPHQCAMAIWPGHGANAPRSITLEILNCSPCPIRIYPGLFVANLTFSRLETPVSIAYDEAGTKYGQDDGIMLPKWNGDFFEQGTECTVHELST